jgi:hypothetical protein
LSGPLSGRPAGTIPPLAHVVPAGERRNKAPIFVSGVNDTRGFLNWLRESCPSGLTAQVKGEKHMLVRETADGFRAAFIALRSLDGGRGVSFHTFSLPEDRIVRLLVRNLGKSMPESAVREELRDLGINAQRVMELRSGRRDQDGAKDRPLTPHFIVSVLRRPDVTRLRSQTELCGLRFTVETYVAPMGPEQCKRCQRFGHTQRNWPFDTVCVLWGCPTIWWLLNHQGAVQMLQLWGQPHGKLAGLR